MIGVGGILWESVKRCMFRYQDRNRKEMKRLVRRYIVLQSKQCHHSISSSHINSPALFWRTPSKLILSGIMLEFHAKLCSQPNPYAM